MVVWKQGHLLWCFIHCIQSITNTEFALIIDMVKNFQIHGLDKQALHLVFCVYFMTDV